MPIKADNKLVKKSGIPWEAISPGRSVCTRLPPRQASKDVGMLMLRDRSARCSSRYETSRREALQSNRGGFLKLTRGIL